MAFALGIAAALAVSLPIIMGQDTNSQQKHLLEPTPNGGSLVRLSALHIQRGLPYPSIVEMKGNVEIETPVCLPAGEEGKVICDGHMIVHADEAKFHEDTGEIEATGNVVVTPLRHEPKN
jgi:hypothetical protein